MIIQALSVMAILGGVLFFIAGTVGVIRFPDVYTRLHALAKADNLGIGLIALGIAFQDPSWREVAKLALLWVIMIVASAVTTNAIAAAAVDRRIRVWDRTDR